MTEHMPQPEQFNGKKHTVAKRIVFKDNSFPAIDIEVHEPVISGPVVLNGEDSGSGVFPGIEGISTFDLNKRAGTKTELADQKASMVGGQPVEGDADFPGVQRMDEMPISSRKDAKRRKYDAKHGSETASFTAEQLQAAREHLQRVLGAAAVVKDELLGERDIDTNDDSDEYYAGRHRAGGRNTHGKRRANRLQRGVYKLGARLDSLFYGRSEDASGSEAENESSPAETAVAIRETQVGDSVRIGGNEWEIIDIDGDEVTVQRTNEEGEDEVDVVPLDVINHAPAAEPQPIYEKMTAEEIGADLEAVRSRFATLAGERTKRAFESKKRTGMIGNVREELSDMIGAVATEMMDELEARGITGDDMAEEIDAFVDEQMDKLVGEIEAERAADYEKRSPLVKKFLDKWASWGEPKGSLLSKNRFKKAAVFAVPGIAIGAVAAPLVGGAAAGLAAAAGARSVARHLMGARLNAAANAGKEARRQASELRGYLDASIDDSHVELLAIFDKQTEKHRKRNRNRLVGGTAIAMTAGILSKEAAEYISESGVIDKVGDWFTDEFGNHTPVAPHVNKTPEIPHNDHLTAAEMFDGKGGSTDFTGEGLKDFNSWINKNGGYRVKSGDSIWKISEHYLKAQGIKNPNKFQIDAVKDDVLKELKSKGFADRKGWLKSGDIIKLK